MNWKNAEGASIADNPCWGGPEPHYHDLQYLLQVLGNADQLESGQNANSSDINLNNEAVQSPMISPSSLATLIDRVIQRIVIHHDENYIAIHKPADLRMDGPHRATVHKLLLYLFPPPSLLQSLQQLDTSNKNDVEITNNENNNNNEMTHIQNRHEHLLKSIAPLTNTSNLNDDPFRTVHQLDYATSGVLLMGKHRRAAGAACVSFQERRARKRYVAVVTNCNNGNDRDEGGVSDGDVPFDQDFFDNMPILPEESLKPWAAGSLEKQYRKKRRRDTDGKDTFNGYMPEHSVFAKWRGCMIKERKKKNDGVDGGNVKKKSKYGKQQHNQQDEVIASLIQSSAQHLTIQEVDELLSIGASWKKVKAYCESSTKENICNWPSTVSKMTKEYNEKTSAAAISTGNEESINSNGRANAATTTASNDEAKTESTPLPPLFRIKDDKDSDSFYICASIGEVADGRFDVLVDPSAANPSSQPNTPAVLPEMKPSLTKCTVLWRGHVNDASTEKEVPVAKVLLSPWTGRRHQLRVHLSRVAGYPILGDVAYTRGTEGRGAIGSRMCLHAKELVIPLLGGQVYTFTAVDPFVVEGKSIQIDNFC